MNIFSNFIPNKYVTFNNKDPPWMTNYLKHKIHCRNSLYLKYLKQGKRNCELLNFKDQLKKFLRTYPKVNNRLCLFSQKVKFFSQKVK